MYRMAANLENVKRNAMRWSKTSFGDIFKKEGEIDMKLDNLQNAMSRGIICLKYWRRNIIGTNAKKSQKKRRCIGIKYPYSNGAWNGT